MINKINEEENNRSKFKFIVSWAIFLTLMSGSDNLSAKKIESSFLDKNKIEIKCNIEQALNYSSSHYYIGDSLDIYGINEFVLFWQEEKAFLKDRVSKNSFIDINIIDRVSFNELNWDFLIYSWNDEQTKFGSYKKYNLKLPSDLKLWELASIIKRVNEITFDGEMPDDASSIEIKKNIQWVIVYLLSLKEKHDRKEVKKAINKYYKLYQYYFPWEDLDIDFMSTNQKQRSTKHFSNTIKNLDAKYGWYSFDIIERVIDESVVNNIYSHFFESFFENGSEMLSNISWLKTRLNIDKLKSDLQTVRKTKNKNLIVKKEKEILNYVITGIRALELEKDNIYSTVYSASSPTEIIKTWDIACVWYSIISNNILEDIGISNDVVMEPWHSLCTVYLADWKKYLFDALRNDKIIKYSTVWHDGAWNIINYKLWSWLQETNKIIWSNWNSQSVIITQILANKANGITGEDKESYKQKLYIFDRAINILNTNPEIFYAKAYVLKELWKHQEALLAIDCSIKLSPTNSISRLLKSMICENLWDFSAADFANKQFEKLRK